MKAAGLAAMLGLFVWVAPSPATATDGFINVRINHSGEDRVGQQLAFYVRDTIRRSGTFKEANAGVEATFALNLITLDPDEDRVQNRTIYSLAIVIENREGLDWYVTSIVGTCGASRLRECAEDFHAELGAELETIRAALMAAP